jgi:hypothetical protein
LKSVTGSTENDVGVVDSNAQSIGENALPKLAGQKENTPLQTEKLLAGLLNSSSSVHPKSQSSQDVTNSEVRIVCPVIYRF